MHRAAESTDWVYELQLPAFIDIKHTLLHPFPTPLSKILKDFHREGSADSSSIRLRNVRIACPRRMAVLDPMASACLWSDNRHSLCFCCEIYPKING